MVEDDYYLDLYDPAGYGQQPPLPIQTAEFAKTLVSQFHIRTHGGNDDVLTPALGQERTSSRGSMCLSGPSAAMATT